MPTLEYLLVFSTEGEFIVKVKFKGGFGNVADRRMDPEQIGSLVDPSTGTFVTDMIFDEHPFKIQKYEFDLKKKIFMIHVG